MPDITMSLDDTLELDTIIEDSSRASNPLSDVDSSFEQYGIQTHTNILNPTEPGDYTITINGQTLSIKVTDPSNIPDSGVARWKYEQNLEDSWNDYNGTRTSSDYSTTSKIGNYGANFSDGTNVIDLSSHRSALQLNEFSFASWVYPRSISNYQGIFCNDFDWNTGEQSGWHLWIRNNEFNIDIFDDSGNYTRLYSTQELSTNTWQHVVFTNDPNGHAVLYTDGVKGNSTSTRTPYYDGTNRVDIANGTAQGENAIQSVIDGVLDDTRIYDKSLTRTEVSNLYSSGSIK